MNKKIILYVALGIVIAALLFFTFFPNMIYAVRDSGVTENAILGQGQGNTDKCTPPEGTSEEEWRTHMSHHPNIYAECVE